MYYKIIVYKKIFFNIQYGKRVIKKVYFQKITQYNNIQKSILTNQYNKIWSKYNDTCYHITFIKQDEDDTIINSYNNKVKKYRQLIEV